jgi:endonuclease/exonuclease/phosphatase family metal-dependent hydrolase
MLSGNKGEACGCPKIQAINCTITIDKKTCQPKGTCDAAEPPPPGPPSCGLPPLGSVPSCSGEIRNDPGDALCGQETYDLIVQPGEMFWQANPFPMEFTDTNSITLPGDAAHQYNTTRCAADMACLQCNCVPDDIMCDQQLGSKTVTCSDYPGCTRTVPTHDYACSAAGSTGDSLSHDQQSDAKCNPPKHPESPLCGERMACWGPNDADGSACCIKPYGADDFISGGPICRQAASQFPFRSLTYTAQREIHLATNLPYYGNIRDRLIQPIAYKEVSVYTRRKPLFAGIIRLFTPYRGADTAPDAVPWYDFHDGDASGWLTIKDPIDPQFGNPVSLSTTRTPFFFPLLGGIQDATSFMRDCLTSAAVYDPTTGITANGCNYSDLSAPNAGNRTPGSGTATNTCTPDPLNPNLCQGLIPDYPLTQMTYNLGALSSSTVELTLVVPEIINYLNQNPIDIIAFQEVDNYFGNNAFTLLESYLKTNNYDYRFMGRKGAGGALQQQHDTGGLLFISRYPISNYQDLTFDVGSYTYPVQGITITYNGQQISYLNHHRPSHTDKCDSLSQLLPKINAYGTADKIVLGDFNAEINECSGFFSNFTDHCPSCTGTKEENGSTADHILGSGIVKNPAAAGIISQLTASDHKAIYSQILFKQESLDESQAIADALAAVTSGNITPPLNYPTCLDINVPNVGDIVTAGQPIAGVDPNGANHPCSTIDHLHFGITENNTFINPASYLKSNNAVVWSLSGSDQPFNFTGSWSWPIDTSVIQGFGNTYLAQQGFYISGAHNGIDMRPSSNSVISAPLDGKFLLHETQCKGQPLTFVILDHGGGVKSWYTHVTLNQCNSTFSGTTCQQACDTFNPGSTAICEFSAPGGPVPVQAGNAYCAARNSAKPNCYCN